MPEGIVLGNNATTQWLHIFPGKLCNDLFPLFLPKSKVHIFALMIVAASVVDPDPLGSKLFEC
jgi:hypothetical protein